MTSRLAHASSDEKQALRQEVWSRLEAAGAALFPGARGRIPLDEHLTSAIRAQVPILKLLRHA